MLLNSDSEPFFTFRYFEFSFKSSLLQFMFNSLSVENLLQAETLQIMFQTRANVMFPEFKAM